VIWCVLTAVLHVFTCLGRQHDAPAAPSRHFLAAFVELAPLLFETERPNKSEEMLSHLYRLARCSEREFHFVRQENSNTHGIKTLGGSG
jgi:hypothetical protein